MTLIINIRSRLINPKSPKPHKPQNPNSIKLLPWIRDLGMCIVQPKKSKNTLPNASKSSHRQRPTFPKIYAPTYALRLGITPSRFKHTANLPIPTPLNAFWGFVEFLRGCKFHLHENPFFSKFCEEVGDFKVGPKVHFRRAIHLCRWSRGSFSSMLSIEKFWIISWFRWKTPYFNGIGV